MYVNNALVRISCSKLATYQEAYSGLAKGYLKSRFGIKKVSHHKYRFYNAYGYVQLLHNSTFFSLILSSHRLCKLTCPLFTNTSNSYFN